MIIKKEADQIISYLEDTSNLKFGNADAVYIPKNEAEVLQTIKEARRNNTPLTASGAGTGTVGGRIPAGGAIISLEKMNNIISIDKKNSKAVLGSGVILDYFLKELDSKKLFYPPFPTERMAFIGSNVATNASGEYSYRFGATRKYVERIRVALSTENILDIRRGQYIADEQGIITSPFFKVKIPAYRSPNIKNAAGYFAKPGMDLIDLFIGSEGTLGIITEVELKLIPALPPRSIMIIFLDQLEVHTKGEAVASGDLLLTGLEKDNGILKLINSIKNNKKLNVYSIEYFDANSLGILKKAFPNIPSCQTALYIEQEKKEMDIWLEILEKYSVVDTWFGDNARDYNKLIDFRHKLPELINEYFREIKQTKVAIDIAVPENYFPELFYFYREMAKTTAVEYVIFGHIGENHLHFNFFPKNEQEKEQAIASYIKAVKKAVQANGTVSAEHGIGKLKHKYLAMMYGREGVMEMARVKKTIDPFYLFGLDNIFPKKLLQD
ncbi:MAG: FAD-binding oxidoreductase [Candidatus Omnitrophica bacterium]|nr:FAD-binding oxidoreductase [Candidatus Omnitrophota bacterium]MBU1047062.1 FAD-binding oxidoreductase [Candidatus Omnitrophota bacterium]MBU1631152.1 FAD-binding oxidoreductase [Candidatus Omnitrophota bacterium]MBU1888999.1 FAD-binding oxidoreductase [Candidatus Omnitrophota bacterium]